MTDPGTEPIRDPWQMLSPEVRVRLAADLAEMVRIRRRALNGAGGIYLD